MISVQCYWCTAISVFVDSKAAEAHGWILKDAGKPVCKQCQIRIAEIKNKELKNGQQKVSG